MKVKAVIMCEDHQNRVKVLRKKDRDSKTFRFGDEVYFLDSDRFQITRKKVLGFFNYHYVTYYYRRGSPKPLPVPNFPGYAESGMEETTGSTMLLPSSEELGAIFNPWFYRTIGKKEASRTEQLQFYATLAAAGLAAYSVYLLTGLPDAIAEAVLVAQAASEQAAQQGAAISP